MHTAAISPYAGKQMRTNIRVSAPVVLFVCLTVAACSENAVVPEIETPPAIGNVTDSFGFAVVAQEFDFSETYALDFTRDTVSVGMTVVGYENGRAHLELFDADGEILYSRDLSRDVAEGSERVMGRPERATLWFEAFTGVVSLGVAAQR